MKRLILGILAALALAVPASAQARPADLPPGTYIQDYLPDACGNPTGEWISATGTHWRGFRTGDYSPISAADRYYYVRYAMGYDNGSSRGLAYYYWTKCYV